jgi:hypothetical protein
VVGMSLVPPTLHTRRFTKGRIRKSGRIDDATHRTVGHRHGSDAVGGKRGGLGGQTDP